MGTSWSEEMASGGDISITVQETMQVPLIILILSFYLSPPLSHQAGFWSIFSADLGVSASTGYNWHSVSSSAAQEQETTTISIKVPPQSHHSIHACKTRTHNQVLKSLLITVAAVEVW